MLLSCRLRPHSAHGPQTMNGTATQASPSRRPTKRRGGGGSGNIARGAQTSGRPQGRRGGSNLALSKPITQADLSPYTSDGQLNGDGSSYESADGSSDEQESARQERFGKIQAGNQYEQVFYISLSKLIRLCSSS